MSEIHKLLFEGMPVRGILVQIDEAWQEVLHRQAQSTQYPPVIQSLLGQMTAATTLLQTSIQFQGSLILQLFAYGALKLAVCEVNSDLGLRSTAQVHPDPHMWPQDAKAEAWHHWVDFNQAQCMMTLDPKKSQSSQSMYQAIVSLTNAKEQPIEHLSEVIEHYMQQSEQLDTKIILAANQQRAAGLLIQRLPIQGQANLAQGLHGMSADESAEHFERIATLAASIKQDELLNLPADEVLHRLFWQEPILCFAPTEQDKKPHFMCTCSPERVKHMIVQLGEAEAHAILEEQGKIEMTCQFCGAQYQYLAEQVAACFA